MARVNTRFFPFAVCRRRRENKQNICTPSVRLIILNFPAFLGAAYASSPAALIVGSSPCTRKSIENLRARRSASRSALTSQ